MCITKSTRHDTTQRFRYGFLLKAHEDLRQDERVMQLFSLVNALLCSEPSTKQRYLDIKRFYVQPLSQQLGPWPARTCYTLAITALSIVVLLASLHAC
jgi:hypothetical protein